MKRDVSFLKNNLIAHRGVHDNKKIPENSILAFKSAIKYGYIIELDLHLLKDGNVVVFHDDNLKRMTGIDKKIKDCTYDEIKDIKLLGTNNHIPLFSDVLDLVSGKVPLLIELKYDTKVGELEKKVLSLLKDYSGKYAIQSFNPLSIYYLKKHAPSVIRGQLLINPKKKANFLKKLYVRSILLNKLSKPDFISYDITGPLSKRLSKAKDDILVLGWVVKDKKDILKNKDACDNFICNNIKDMC